MRITLRHNGGGGTVGSHFSCHLAILCSLGNLHVLWTNTSPSSCADRDTKETAATAGLPLQRADQRHSTAQTWSRHPRPCTRRRAGGVWVVGSHLRCHIAVPRPAVMQVFSRHVICVLSKLVSFFGPAPTAARDDRAQGTDPAPAPAPWPPPPDLDTSRDGRRAQGLSGR